MSELVDRLFLQPQVIGDLHPAKSVPCVSELWSSQVIGHWIAVEVLPDLP